MSYIYFFHCHLNNFAGDTSTWCMYPLQVSWRLLTGCLIFIFKEFVRKCVEA